MHTQCPECEIAFRVTAKILRQTNNNVQCDSCGHAFNALEFLSEDIPEQASPGIADTGDEPAGDLALSEPEDWVDILEELYGPTVESLEVKNELTSIHGELSVIDDALTDEVPQMDEGFSAPEEDMPDDIETDLIEQIEAGAAAELDADEIDDEVDDAAPEEDAHAADRADDNIDKDEADPDEPFNIATTTVGVENPEALFDESSGEVETIIMEGEFFRREVEKERIAAEYRTRSQLDNSATLMDTSARNRGKAQGGQHSYDPPSLFIGTAIVGLALVLVGQFVHNHRQSMVTYDFFNATIAPVYRFLGSPVTPDWDVNGWQFEATNGSIDDENTRLTIVSRIANRSNRPLPYPLVHVELTDRFDDVTGSAILKFSDYLAVDGDPGPPIAPRDNFTATITIDDPSVEVYGYRLKVCYRAEPGAVRCAAEAFRD